ncbi:hypothetical protein CDCA_CDCA15G3956 [Cyanidium caldarium]|uniref:Agmatine deiminase n=1 Tax=Cyanidium caldarium TaxID=2771 RepID=A0AAV9J0K6_CYACA|nr:hypothetical protein CDCA_CDCA15G3956 [Cyanidium caldarium]
MNDSSSKTPRQQGLYLPAEWHPHVGCWIGWPERADNWPQPSRRVHPVMVSLIHAIARYEPVTVVCSAAAFASVCAQLLPSREPPDGLQPPSTVRIVEMSCNDCWLRDTAPLFVIPGAELPFASVAGVDSAFNAWGGSGGGCYPDWSLDAQVARKVLQLERLPRFVNPMVLEGGSITVDGEGTLITTEQCLLNANRNPGWSRQRIEAQLRAYLGVECVLWLPLGIAGDADTDGHVDNLCVFLRPACVALHWAAGDECCERAARALTEARDARGRRLQVVRLTAPPPLYRRTEDLPAVDAVSAAGAQAHRPREAGTLLPASYVNFYRANGAVIMPAFGHAASDAAARSALQEALPEVEMVQIEGAREILLGGGNIHCLTQQQPQWP